MNALPLPSRNDDDADRRAYLASIPTAELVLPGTPAGVHTAPLAAQPSIDISDLGTMAMIPPEVEAAIPVRLLMFAERHQDDAEADRREARRFRAEANDMERNLDHLRATQARYVERRDQWLDYAQHRPLTPPEQKILSDAETAIMDIDAQVAEIRACMIATRQGARRLDDKADERMRWADRLRRAARAEGSSNASGQGRA